MSADLPAELLEEITKRQAAAVAAVEFPHHDPAWVPSTGALSARIVEAPDHPYYEYLTDLTLEQKAALPARFHLPAFDNCGVPNAWLCTVCWDEGTVTGWPCATARKHGAEVFGQSREDVHRARLESALADVVRLTAERNALDKMCDEVMTERDALHDVADSLAYAIAPIEVIGEHSSENDPWQNALDHGTQIDEMQNLRNENARLQARVTELETARCHAGALAEQRHQLLDPAEPPLCVAAIATPTAPAVAA